MPLNEKKRAMLKLIWDDCIKDDKSTEYAIEFMKDTAKCTPSEVMNYLYETRDREAD